MTREDRLRAALVDIAENSDHANHAYLICGKCMAVKALAHIPPPKPKKAK